MTLAVKHQILLIISTRTNFQVDYICVIESNNVTASTWQKEKCKDLLLTFV